VWAILFAFSFVARYRPVVWTGCLDLDRSPDAVLLQLLMDTAQTMLPRLVLDALLRDV
jgi:hypothetical protein